MPSDTKITWKYPKMYCIWGKSKSQDYVYHDLSYAFKEGTEHVHTCVNIWKELAHLQKLSQLTVTLGRVLEGWQW